MTTAYQPQRTWRLEDRISDLITEFDQFGSEISTECAEFNDGCAERIGQLERRRSVVAAQIVALTTLLIRNGA